jgi:Ca2+-transporting ATPase
MKYMTATKMWHFGVPAPFDVAKLALSSMTPVTRTILRIGNIANDARLPVSPLVSDSPQSIQQPKIIDSYIKSRWVGQPTDVAMLDLLDLCGEDDVRDKIGQRYVEKPFSPDQKWMGVGIESSLMGGGSVSATTSETIVVYIKGALEEVLSRCDTYLLSDGRESVLDSSLRQEVLNTGYQMAQEGLRVIGFAAGSVTFTPRIRPKHDIYLGLTFAGVIGMKNSQ